MSEEVSLVDDDDGHDEYSEIPIRFSKDFWTLELVEFLMKVGVRHRVQLAEGMPPFKWTSGDWTLIGEREAIDLLRSHGKISSAKVEPRLAPPGISALWTFEMMWPDVSAKTWRKAKIAMSTSGAWRLIEEFQTFKSTGVFSEGATLDRRIAEQEDVDLELHNAVNDGDLKAVLLALAKGADPDLDVGGFGLTAFVATQHMDVYLPILRALIDGGAALDGITIGDWNSQPPLWAAARMENLPAVRLLLDLGADPNCSYLGRSVQDLSEDDGFDVNDIREIKRLLLETHALREQSAISILVPEPEAGENAIRKRRRLDDQP